MPNQKLGITATELFACNPFRILGLPVNSSDDEISATYKKLLAMAGTPEADSYTTDFDFPSLPPFKRDEVTLRTAYAKLASNGYRCFAYSDGIFSQALNIDDVMLNLEDITSYDCFLRCYMWLITNDRDFEEPELWVPLCKYIDKLIASGQDKWAEYFDCRFPAPMDKDPAALQSFRDTFKDIILLPIKEMVRGSMRCKTAVDILRAAKIDVDEKFPAIDIPQANKPRPGEPEPKLKIAVKDGEEYFDVTAGKMVSFASDSEAAIENNNFAETTTTISAAAIVGEEEPVKPAAPVQPEPPAPEPVAAAETPASEPETPVRHVEPVVVPQKKKPKPAIVIPEETPAVTPEPISFAAEDSAPTINVPSPEETMPKQEEPAVYTSPKTEEPAGFVMTESSPVDPFAVPTASVPSSAAVKTETTTGARRRKVSLTGLDGLEDSGVQSAPDIQLTAPKGTKPAAQSQPVQEEHKKPKTERKTLTDIIDEVESRTEETADQLLTEQEEEDNLYTDALVKLLRANRSNKMMKEVDTSHIFDNGDSMGKSTKADLTMDAINMKKIDMSNLDSSYGAKKYDESDPKKAIKEKYKNININDMLNPTMGNKLNREYQPSAIDEFQKEKQQQKNMSKFFLKFFGTVILVLAIVLFLYFGTQ